MILPGLRISGGENALYMQGKPEARLSAQRQKRLEKEAR